MFDDTTTTLDIIFGTIEHRSKHYESNICCSALSWIYLWTSLSGAVALKETWSLGVRIRP